jgi:hypothetical protein
MKNNQSFVRFGGLAGILLAITSWTTVAVFYVFVPPAQRPPVSDISAFLESLTQTSGGIQLYNFLYALIAVWAFIGIAAMYYKVREVNPAWAVFATGLGLIASFMTVLNGLQQVAEYRFLATLYSSAKDVAVALYGVPAPLNPLNATTMGLTAPWFLIMSILMLRTNLPKLLAYLGFVAFADLVVGFVASILDIQLVTIAAAVIAGAVGGPVFWLWLGVLLRREEG